MYFANPWGLLGLLALPAIVAIHMFHHRFPPLIVAGAHLWGVETLITSAGRRRDRLPITRSLLLELLAALLITLGLSEPRITDLSTVRHLVIVLDDSASMQGTIDGETCRNLAVAEIRKRMESESRQLRLTLIRTGNQPTLMGIRAMPRAEAEEVLREWQPHAARHDFQPAWDEALHVLGGDGEFLFLTDSLPEETVALPASMELLALGRSLDNAAISAARWTFDSTTHTGKVFFRISNYGRRPQNLAVSGRSQGQAIFDQQVRIQGGDELPFEIEVPGGLGTIVISISSPDDGLPVDNQITLIEPAIRLVTIAVTLSPDSVASTLTERGLRVIPDWQPGPFDQAHLWIGPASELPPSRKDLTWLGLGPIDSSEEGLAAARDLVGPFILEKQNSLLDGVTLGGVVWGGVQPLDLALVPIVSSGQSILLGQLVSTETLGYLVNIDLQRSNLGSSPDWPILLANLVEDRRNLLPGLRRWNYRINEEIRLQLDPLADGDKQNLQLVEPNGARRTLIRDRNHMVEITRLQQSGIYSIEEGAHVHGRFAVNFFDPQESDLTAIRPGHRRPKTSWEPTSISLDNPYSWLILLAILLILGSVLYDWLLVRRQPNQMG